MRLMPTCQSATRRGQSILSHPGGMALAGLLLAAHAGCSSATPASGPAGGSTGSSGGDAGVGSGSGGASSGSGGTGSSSGDTSSGGGSSGSSGIGSSSGAPPGSSSGSGSGSSSGAGSSSGSGGSSSGGKGGDAGTMGVGAGDGGVAAGGCAGKTYKLCEDFETGMAGAVPTGWSLFKGYNTGSPTTDAVLATDQFHSGKMALKSDSMANGQYRVQKSLMSIGATATKHWGRVLYKVQTPAPKPTGSAVIHITFVGLVGAAGINGENRIVDTVEDSRGMHQWLYNVPSDSCCSKSQYNWSFDTAWHCAEWYVDVSTKSYRFFTDSQEVPALAFTGNAGSQMTNYTGVVVGATSYQPFPSPYIMWFDDLAIDDNQIGCQ